MLFPVPDRVKDIRDAVHRFMTERVEPAEPAEPALNAGDRGVLQDLREQAKKEGLRAPGHPKELGGGGLPFPDYVYVNEVQGRSEWGQMALGTFTLQDSLVLHKYASPRWRERYLAPLVAGEVPRGSRWLDHLAGKH